MMADLFDKAAKAKENLEKEVVKEDIERKSFDIRQLALEYSDFFCKKHHMVCEYNVPACMDAPEYMKFFSLMKGNIIF